MISISNLEKKYEDIVIYKKTSYTFKDKALTCFLGPSGSGKTTLLNLIAGFDTDYKGEINVNGIDLKKLTMDELCEYRFNNIGFIFQDYNLLKGYTSLENVFMAIHLNNDITECEKKSKARGLLVKLGLEAQIDQSIETLSGGQKQRVAIARALINNPSIILADEPTGALDSDSTKSIMEILKEISKERTVIIITHDEEVAKYADEVVELEDNKIVTKKALNSYIIGETKTTNKPILDKKISRNISLKNFKIHLFKFILTAIIIAFGSSAFIAAFASKNITNKVINDFKTKNIFYNKGQVPLNNDNGIVVNDNIEEVFNILNSMDEAYNVYYQYDLENITIKNDNKTVDIPIKVPTATSNETMSYGVMPRTGKNEMVLSANIANRLEDNIKNILGKQVTLQYYDKENKLQELTLTVSGLTNSPYQDFIVSTDIEREIYSNLDIDNKPKTAVAFDIKSFEDIPNVDKILKEKGIRVFTKANEVEVFQKSFTSLLNLYTVLSYLILIVGIFISVVILYRISIERYREVGVLGALGYTKKNIKKIMFKESIYFAAVSTTISGVLIKLLDVIYATQFGYGLDIDIVLIALLISINLSLTIGLSYLINIKIIKTETVIALRK